MARRFDIYRGHDPREIATYSIAEAAHWLQIPRTTLQAWVGGHPYRAGGKLKRSDPVILIPDQHLPLLSFINLVEAHILDAIRFRHNVPLPKVRRSIEFLREYSGSAHPLADYWFQITGVDLLIDEAGIIVNTTKRGQLEMKEIIRAYLHRVDRDPQGTAERLYPYVTRHRRPGELEEEPKLVLIDPRISFGKPILVGVGVPTAVIADRNRAGESIQELAADYGCETSEIKEAIRYELAAQKAA